MLVLSRHVNESIILTLPDGQIITLMVVDIRGDKTRIGISAAKDIAVHRQEVHEAIKREAVAKAAKESEAQ